MDRNPSTKLSLAIISFALATAMFWSSACMSRNMEADAQSVTGAEFGKLAPGATVKVVLEISNATSGAIEGMILDPNGQNSYVRSSVPVHVSFDSSTQIVMGEAKDIRSGGVVHATGKLASERTLQAKQLVILTGYAKVK